MERSARVCTAHASNDAETITKRVKLKKKKKERENSERNENGKICLSFACVLMFNIPTLCTRRLHIRRLRFCLFECVKRKTILLNLFGDRLRPRRWHEAKPMCVCGCCCYWCIRQQAQHKPNRKKWIQSKNRVNYHSRIASHHHRRQTIFKSNEMIFRFTFSSLNCGRFDNVTNKGK